MDYKSTLEEQLHKAKNGDRISYAERMLRLVEGEKTPELYDELCNPPIFVRRDATRLLAEIITDNEDGNPTTAMYVRKPENAPAFAYLVALNLVDVQEQPYLGLFKRKVIVPKKKSSS